MSEGAWVRSDAMVWNEEYQAWEHAWGSGYDPGTDEAALLHNLEHCEEEQPGKIYYIQSYLQNGLDSSLIDTDVPYMVIGINHDGSDNTIDLMAKVGAYKSQWNSVYSDISYGRYDSSYCNFYSWLHNTCINGYSDNIQSKMCNMIERYRYPSGDSSGTLQYLNTKVKIANPMELFGSSITNYSYSSDIGSAYGTLYEAFTNSTSFDEHRQIYSNKAMSSEPTSMWTNSYYRSFYDGHNYVYQYGTYANGSVAGAFVINISMVAPIIRLSANPS